MKPHDYRLPKVKFSAVDDYLKELEELHAQQQLIFSLVRIEERHRCAENLDRLTVSLVSGVLTRNAIYELEVILGEMLGEGRQEVDSRYREIERKILRTCERLNLQARGGVIEP